MAENAKERLNRTSQNIDLIADIMGEESKAALKEKINKNTPDDIENLKAKEEVKKEVTIDYTPFIRPFAEQLKRELYSKMPIRLDGLNDDQMALVYKEILN